MLFSLVYCVHFIGYGSRWPRRGALMDGVPRVARVLAKEHQAVQRRQSEGGRTRRDVGGEIDLR